MTQALLRRESTCRANLIGERRAARGGAAVQQVAPVILVTLSILFTSSRAMTLHDRRKHAWMPHKYASDAVGLTKLVWL